MRKRAELLLLMLKITTPCRASTASPDRCCTTDGKKNPLVVSEVDDAFRPFFRSPDLAHKARQAYHKQLIPATAQVQPVQKPSAETVDVTGDGVASGDGQPEIFDLSDGSDVAGDGVRDCDDERQEDRGSPMQHQHDPGSPVKVHVDDRMSLAELQNGRHAIDGGPEDHDSFIRCGGNKNKVPGINGTHLSYPFALHPQMGLPWTYVGDGAMLLQFANQGYEVIDGMHGCRFAGRWVGPAFLVANRRTTPGFKVRLCKNGFLRLPEVHSCPRVRLRRGEDVTMALLLVVRHVASDGNDSLQGRLIRLTPYKHPTGLKME